MVDIRGPCEVCGYVSQLGAVARHHLIPESVTEQADKPKSETVSLCCNCYFELHKWYKMRVADMVYDLGAQHFKAKSWEDKVKEYESAFRAFKKYKDEQRKTGQRKRA